VAPPADDPPVAAPESSTPAEAAFVAATLALTKPDDAPEASVSPQQAKDGTEQQDAASEVVAPASLPAVIPVPVPSQSAAIDPVSQSPESADQDPGAAVGEAAPVGPAAPAIASAAKDPASPAIASAAKDPAPPAIASAAKDPAPPAIASAAKDPAPPGTFPTETNASPLGADEPPSADAPATPMPAESESGAATPRTPVQSLTATPKPSKSAPVSEKSSGNEEPTPAAASADPKVGQQAPAHGQQAPADPRAEVRPASDRRIPVLPSATDDVRPTTAAANPSLAGVPADPIHTFTPAVIGHAAASRPADASGPSAPALATTVPIAGVAVAIAAQAVAGKNRFAIRLDPPELGRIDVRLDVDRDGRVTSRLVVERADTLDLLRRDAPQLERALHDVGLKTGTDAMQFSLRDQGSGQQRQGYEPPARSTHLVLPDEAPPPEATRNYGRLFGRVGGVDIRV
jgi:flagellar hook-length control protein FliK